MRIGGRILGLAATLTLALSVPSVVAAKSPIQVPPSAAAGAYVEQIPTATGSVVSDSTSPTTDGTAEASPTGGAATVAGTAGGDGQLLALALVLFGVTVGIVLGRVRLGGDRNSRS